jgi:hypothetical protein
VKPNVDFFPILATADLRHTFPFDKDGMKWEKKLEKKSEYHTIHICLSIYFHFLFGGGVITTACNMGNGA